MSRILVTGASGFLGGALVRKLHSGARDVVATGRNIEKLRALGLPDHSILCLDLAKPSMAAACEAHLKGVTTIVHCAGLSSPWGTQADFHRANVTATENVVALAKRLGGIHLVFVSTPSVYFQFKDQFDVGEGTSLPKPVNAYASTKALAETRVAPVAYAIRLSGQEGFMGHMIPPCCRGCCVRRARGQCRCSGAGRCGPICPMWVM